MFKVIKKQVRPSTSVEFYDITDEELKAYLLENYVLTGKMQRPTFEISENGLEHSTTVLFASEEVAREWKYDPVVSEKLHTPQQAYSAANGISLLPTNIIGEV